MRRGLYRVKTDSLFTNVSQVGKLATRNVVTGRCACVQCGFIVRKGEPFLSEIVLAEQIAARTPDIFKELGIEN